MSLTVHINHSADIHELINKYQHFDFLKSIAINESNSISWSMSNSYWNLKEAIIYQIQVMFIGKSGYGKSTTLNKIIGKDVFECDDIKACTKDLYSANYRLQKNENHFFALCDLPGIGESNDADVKYNEWYKEMLIKSQCVVYILRADQRDFSIDELLFKKLFKTSLERKKVIIALNFADKIEPLSRNLSLSPTQIENLNTKVIDVQKIFNVSKGQVLYYSAQDMLNIDLLVDKMTKVIKANI